MRKTRRERAATPPMTPPAIAPTGVKEDCEAEGSEVAADVVGEANEGVGDVKEGGSPDAATADDAAGVEDAGLDEELGTTVAGSISLMLAFHPSHHHFLSPI